MSHNENSTTWNYNIVTFEHFLAHEDNVTSMLWSILKNSKCALLYIEEYNRFEKIWDNYGQF